MEVILHKFWLPALWLSGLWLGYMYGVQFFFGPAGYSAVAVNTAVIFMLLGAGVICARPDRGIIPC